jgi:hypothetical protein
MTAGITVVGDIIVTGAIVGGIIVTGIMDATMATAVGSIAELH